MFTLLVPGPQKSNFSSGLEIIQGGALGPWEYQKPTPDAAGTQNHAQKSHFHVSQISQFWNIKNEISNTVKNAKYASERWN